MILRTISYVGPSFTLNNERTMHHHGRAKLVAAWREPIAMMVRSAENRWRTPAPVGIEVRSECRADADRGAYFPAAKAMIDGLTDQYAKGGERVHVGWWPDDDGSWVLWERHWVPVRNMQLPTGCIRVTLEVVEP